MSVPDFSSQLSSSDKNRVSNLFQKKKNKRSGYNNLTVFEEEEGKPESPDPAKPSKAELKSKSKQHHPIVRPKVFGEDSTHKVATPPESPSPDPQNRPLPHMNYKRTGQNGSPKLGGAEPRRRPPPPRPPPFAKTHPTQAAKLDQIIRSQNTEVEENVTIETESLTPEPMKERVQNKSPEDKPEEGNLTRAKESSSMEDLLNNLKEFDECSAEHSYATLTEVQMGTDVDYEIIKPPTPTSPKEVVTIKISDYKPDTDDELLDDEELDGTDEEVGLTEEPEEDATRPIDGKLFAEDESWNPREWVPSPEPPPIKTKPQPLKKPSWGIDVQPHAKNGSSTSNELSKPKVPPYVLGGSSPQLNRMVSPQFNKGTSSPQPPSSSPQFSAKASNLPKPFVPGSSPQLPVRAAPSSQDPPLPPPMIISRPRKSPAHSPQLVSKQEHVDAAKKKTPPPVPPPRQKRKPGGTIGGPPDRPAPPPPPSKPKGFTSSHSDMDLRVGLPRKPLTSHHQQNSKLGDRR